MEGTQDEFIDAELQWIARSAKDLPPSSSAGTVHVYECIESVVKGSTRLYQAASLLSVSNALLQHTWLQYA